MTSPTELLRQARLTNDSMPTYAYIDSGHNELLFVNEGKPNDGDFEELVKRRDAISAIESAVLAKLDAKQAQIDALMFEYCQEDMTTEQIDEWCKRQRAVSPERQRKINAALQQEQNNGL